MCNNCELLEETIDSFEKLDGKVAYYGGCKRLLVIENNTLYCYWSDEIVPAWIFPREVITNISNDGFTAHGYLRYSLREDNNEDII